MRRKWRGSAERRLLRRKREITLCVIKQKTPCLQFTEGRVFLIRLNYFLFMYCARYKVTWNFFLSEDCREGKRTTVEQILNHKR